MTGEDTDGRRVVGGVLADRYELGHRLGRGGTAVVFDAWDRVLDRRVAVKVLDALFTHPNLRERFLREARAAAGLAHPGLVAVLDTGEHEGLPFIVMEHVDGPTLAETLAAEGALPPGRAAQVGLDVCDALAAAHAHGLVHRDVKPANIMLPATGGAKVMDFGIARALGDNVALTLTTGVLGTPHYMAPEQIAAAPPDARSDLYSLGVVLYECLTGRPPFHGPTALAVAFQHVRVTPVPARRVRPEVPAALEAVTMRALAKDPAQRWQTAAQFQDALRRASAGLDTPTPVAPAPPARRMPGLGDDGLGLFRSPGEVWHQPGRATLTAAPPARRHPPRGRVLGVVVTTALFAGLLAVGVVVGLRIPTGARPPTPATRLAADPAPASQAPTPTPTPKDDLSFWWAEDPVPTPAAATGEGTVTRPPPTTTTAPPLDGPALDPDAPDRRRRASPDRSDARPPASRLTRPR